MNAPNIPQGIEHISIGMLTPYARNSRTHSPEQVAQICASIREFGFTNPVLIDARGEIIAGHGRVMAATNLGMTAVPCIRLGHLSDMQKRAYVIADNKLALNAGWNDDVLAEELRALQEAEFDIDLLGFSSDELGELLEPSAAGAQNHGDPDAIPDTQLVPISRLGDVWVLGSHRIICGDSTDAGTVAKLMNGYRCEMCFTSPPYGAGKSAKLRDHYVRGAKKRESFYDQHEDRIDEWAELMRSWYAVARQFCDVVVCNVQMLADNKVALIEWLQELRGDLCDVVVWDKGHGAPQMQSNVLNNAFEFVFIIGGNGSRSVPFGKFHGSVSNVVRINPKGANDHAEIHRAVMPIDLALWVIRDLCGKAASIYEPFSGSGTTIIACEQTGRSCYAIELSPAYVDVAVKRWQTFTGREAVLEGEGRTFAQIETERA